MSDFDYYPNLDLHPLSGSYDVKFGAKLSDSGIAFECFKKLVEDGDDSLKVLTPGKIYTIIKVEGYGDVADFIFIGDNGQEFRLCEFFFEKA